MVEQKTKFTHQGIVVEYVGELQHDIQSMKNVKEESPTAIYCKISALPFSLTCVLSSTFTVLVSPSVSIIYYVVLSPLSTILLTLTPLTSPCVICSTLTVISHHT
jgi:hypothetical protein